MERLAFDLVSNKKKSKFDIAISEKFFYIGLVGFGVLLLIFKLSENYFDANLEDFPMVRYVMYGLLVCILIGTLYGLVDYNGNNRIIKGIITFDENEITLNHITKYRLSEIENLKFSVDDYKGRLINLITDGDPKKSYGGDNYVEFTYQNKKYKYQFVVDSIAHGKLLLEKTIPKMRTKTVVKY